MTDSEGGERSQRAPRARLGDTKLIVREWSRDRGVLEHEELITDLAELLQTCLSLRSHVPERITLTGTDDAGREHALTFAFASLKTGS